MTTDFKESGFQKNLVAPDASIRRTLMIIDGHGVPIGLVHENGKLIGTVTDGDVRRGLLAGVTLDEAVTKVMNPTPITIPAGTSDAAALRLMQTRSILYVPTIDDTGRIVDLKVFKNLQPGRVRENTLVLLMAGGLGTRLRPHTETVPTPMLEVGGKPILETIVEQFVDQGFTDLLISVNYRKEMVQDYFTDGQKWGARIRYVEEDEPRGTAGALALLPERPSRPMIVMNGDVLTRVSFNHLVKFHAEHGAAATMCVREVPLTVPYGVIEADGINLTAIVEKPKNNVLINAGIYALSPDAFDVLPQETRFDMPDLFAKILETSRERGTPPPTVFPLWEVWNDIGTEGDLEKGRQKHAKFF